jgi:hypothetical protein
MRKKKATELFKQKTPYWDKPSWGCGVSEPDTNSKRIIAIH